MSRAAHLAVALAFLAGLAACGGKVVLDPTGGGGFGGGSSIDSGSSDTGVTVGPSSSTAVSVGPTSSSTGTEPCFGCSAALTDPNASTEQLCPFSETLYVAFVECACMGACESSCGPTACSGIEASAECTSCVQEPTTGCGDELNECLNDF